jgi:hypothetical protein
MSFPFRPHPLPPEKRELAAATASISLHATPASSSAASTAVRHICVSDLSANFPQGCIPRPTAATSLMLPLLRSKPKRWDDQIGLNFQVMTSSPFSSR